MGELKRLLRSKATPLERQMLKGGASEQPNLRTRRRMAQALGLSPLVVYTSAAKALLSSWWVQAGLGVTLAAGVAALGTAGIPPDGSADTSAPESAAVQPAMQVAEQKPASAPAEDEQRVDSAAAAPDRPASTRSRQRPPASSRPAPRKVGKSRLALEISLIDRARALIADGRPDRALLVLDTYSSTFPKGVLAPEAELLRSRARR